METPFMHAKKFNKFWKQKRKDLNVVLDAPQTVAFVHP